MDKLEEAKKKYEHVSRLYEEVLEQCHSYPSCIECAYGKEYPCLRCELAERKDVLLKELESERKRIDNGKENLRRIMKLAHSVIASPDHESKCVCVGVNCKECPFWVRDFIDGGRSDCAVTMIRRRLHNLEHYDD